MSDFEEQVKEKVRNAFLAQRQTLVNDLLRAETNTDIRQIMIDELKLRSSFSPHKDVVRNALRIVEYFVGDNA